MSKAIEWALKDKSVFIAESLFITEELVKVELKIYLCPLNAIKLEMSYLKEDLEKRIKFEQFFILTYPKVKAFAKKLLKSEEDAEDVAQDVFVKFWSNSEIWENQMTWNSYIYTMVRNNIYNFLKHKSVEYRYQEQLSQDDCSPEPDIHDILYAKEIELLYKLALEEMPEQRKKVFVMSRQKGMSNQEIADNLQISIRTVERHISLALQDLRKIILIAFFSYFC